MEFIHIYSATDLHSSMQINTGVFCNALPLPVFVFFISLCFPRVFHMCSSVVPRGFMVCPLFLYHS